MINKGDSVYIVFNNGKGVMDSQGKQYMYKSEKAFRKWFPRRNNLDDFELIEYAPVRHGGIIGGIQQ